MKRFLLRIQTYLRKLAGIPVPDEMPMPQSDIEKSLYEICKNNPNGIMPGVQPSGTIPITENGTYNVAEFAEAVVEVEEVQGMVDMAINYTDPNGNAVSVTVRDNEVIGYSTQQAASSLYIPLRKTFTLQTNDEIRLTLSNVNNCDVFWDIGFACVAARSTKMPNINVITNVRIQNGITEYTYNGNPIPVSGIYVLSRSTLTNGNVKIGLSINGETLF